MEGDSPNSPCPGLPEAGKAFAISDHRKAYLFALGLLLFSWLGFYARFWPRAFMYSIGFMNSLTALIFRSLRLGNAWSLVLTLAFNSFFVFLISYLIARLWLKSSRQFKLCLVAVALLSSLSAWALNYYENRVDWTTRGLSPDRPGFKPQVVILAGTFDYWINDTSIGQIKSGTANFEIRMRGFDNYYCKKWKGHEWKVGSWFRVELALKDFSQTWGLSSLSYTTRGGGGSWFGPDDIILARRLWSGGQFVGARSETLEAETRQWGMREEFSRLMKVGPYLVPGKIKLSERNERIETYTVKKVEFSSLPSEEWFKNVKAKYFDRTPALRMADLGEPGVIPGRGR